VVTREYGQGCTFQEAPGQSTAVLHGERDQAQLPASDPHLCPWGVTGALCAPGKLTPGTPW